AQTTRPRQRGPDNAAQTTRRRLIKLRSPSRTTRPLQAEPSATAEPSARYKPNHPLKGKVGRWPPIRPARPAEAGRVLLPTTGRLEARSLSPTTRAAGS